MISVIIASVNTELLEKVKKNIADTIGLKYEIISFENNNNRRGLCAIYNEGLQLANFPIICFMHEDISIKTKGWGAKVVHFFKENHNLGVLGLAGSSYKSFAPSSWGIGGNPNTETYHFIQKYKNNTKPDEILKVNAREGVLGDAVVVDGMWFCTTKCVGNEYIFDENNFKGFHCYDLDFCLQVGCKYDIKITTDIFIEHFSEGGFNHDWVNETYKLHQKWSQKLPRSIGVISEKEKNRIEKSAYVKFIVILAKLNFSLRYIFNFLLIYKRKSNMSFSLFFKLSYYLLRFKLLRVN